MGLIDDIKTNAKENGTKVQTTRVAKLDELFNALFYAPKNMEEEVAFVKQMFTRGGDSHERYGLHTSAIIVCEEKFCMREQVLSLIYKQRQGENVPMNLKRIFEEGNAIHEKWQRLFIRGGLGKATDMDFSRFNKQYEIGYTPDAILTIPDVVTIGPRKIEMGEAAGQYVIEIKSVNTHQFMKMESHPSGAKQMQMYMRFTGIHQGIVLCDDKNTQNFKMFYYKYTPEATIPFIERLEGVQYYKQRVLTEGKMVGRCKACPTKLSKRAVECPMRDACWGTGMGRVRLDVPKNSNRG